MKIALVEVPACDLIACPWHLEYSNKIKPHLIKEERK